MGFPRENGNFVIMVYNSKGDPDSVIANIIGAGEDISYMRGKGDYYLSINTAQDYKIVVEQKI